jgi:hypothetical protein
MVSWLKTLWGEWRAGNMQVKLKTSDSQELTAEIANTRAYPPVVVWGESLTWGRVFLLAVGDADNAGTGVYTETTFAVAAVERIEK